MEKKLKEEILKLFEEYDFISFYIGDQGAFDYLSRITVGKLKQKKKLPCEIVYISPYLKMPERGLMKYFESTIYLPLETVPKKYAILRRNKWMIEQADILIAYVWDITGGTFKTLEYAEQRQRNHGKPRIINMAK